MHSLMNKRIVLGVTGGIAAYKAAELTRLLVKLGAEVRVVMTQGATAFVAPLTFQALSGSPVHTELLDPDAEAGMGHIALAKWADAIVVAPASANCLARLAQGFGNDLLTTVCLASAAPLAVAPAMNQAMWSHAATVANVQTLKSRGVIVWGPDSGEQACGDVGPGRMLEAEVLAECVSALFESGILVGKTVVITAGPTREAIDPVRYLSNRSSGKMGYALAAAAVEAGARVVLISGPTALPPVDRATMIMVESASEMLEASLQYVGQMDLFIAAAAVADFRPESVAQQKIKKQDSHTMQTLTLVKNPDIVATVAEQSARPYVVGFAAETQNLIAYAEDKRRRKNLDMVVANDVSQSNIGFNSDDNAVEVILKDRRLAYQQKSKRQLARELIALMAKQINHSA